MSEKLLVSPDTWVKPAMQNWCFFSYVILKEIIQYEIMTHHWIRLSTSLLILRNFAFKLWQPESSITVKDAHFFQSNCISLASWSILFSSELSIQSDKLLMGSKALRYVGILKLCQQNETEVLGHMLISQKPCMPLIKNWSMASV